MDNSNLFLDSKAVAAILMVSKRTLQNYRSEGKLVFYKISPKTIRYRVEDVVDFLKQSNCCSYQKDRVNYKPQNKMFHFCKTFCSKITLVNTIQNVILNPI